MNFINKLFERKKALKGYKNGIALYNEKQFPKAIEQFESMLREKTLSKSIEYNLARFYCSQAHRNIGVIQFAKGNNENALAHFTAALDYNPNHTDLNYFVGICLNNIGKFEEAIESFNKLQKIDPENIPNKLKMAIIFYNQGLWDNAEKINRSILDKKPKYADVHFHLGLCLLSQGKALEASDAFESALKINPGYMNAQLKLSIAQACLGEFEMAFDNLTAILENYPDYADVNYLMGILKCESNLLEEGISYLQKALELNPKFKNAQIKLMLFLCQDGKIEQAKEQVEAALKLYPEDKRMNSAHKLINAIVESARPENGGFKNQLERIFGEEHILEELVNEFYTYLDIMPNFSEIIALFSNSKFVEADESIAGFMIPLILEHIDKHPEYPDLYNSLGSQFLYAGKLIEAEAAFTKAVELNPEYVTARINLMKTLQKMGEHEKAYGQAHFLILKKLPYPDVYYCFIEILCSLEKFEDALRYAEDLIKIKPNSGRAYFLKAQVYGATGQIEQAKQQIKKCVSCTNDPKLSDEAQKLLKNL